MPIKKPAKLVPWLSEPELLEWLRSATSAEEYRKRITIWLTHFRKWSAREIGDMVGASVQSIWLWVGQYNQKGPEGLYREGRGGRRWAFLSEEEEGCFLQDWEEGAQNGQLITVKQLHRALCEKVGKEVSLGYVYRLLHRNRWRKLGPRPRHVKADKNAQEDFKKNFLRRSHKL